jgi:hypothetical protein
MRLPTWILFAALLTAPSAVAQEPIFGSTPGQVLDSVPIYIGMDFGEARTRLSTRFEFRADASPTDSHAVFVRNGEPLGSGTINLVGRDGRVFLLGSDWTTAEESREAFAAKLVELLGLISSQDGARAQARDCQLSMMGGPEGSSFRLAEIACGRHMIHIVRTRAPDGGERSSLQLLTR